MSLGDDHTLIVQCEFITGSDAQGCMVVLVGGLDNVTANLTRNSKSTLGTLALTKPLSSYLKVLAFDIERDGSIGTVAVAGDIVSTYRTIIVKNSGLYTTYNVCKVFVVFFYSESSLLWTLTFGTCS